MPAEAVAGSDGDPARQRDEEVRNYQEENGRRFDRVQELEERERALTELNQALEADCRNLREECRTLRRELQQLRQEAGGDTRVVKLRERGDAR